MNTAVALKSENAVAAMTRGDLVRVLGSSLYPGASPQSIELVLGYCEAAGLDPMQKPVHIVPMWDGKAKQMRDVIMPGVGLYRTNAARSGAFAGLTEPEFGDMVDGQFHDRDGKIVDVEFPEWCRVTAKRRLATGEIAEFTAVEYWEENYATAGKEGDAPNAMWKKRPRGQLAKCAQAQALRIAFPELASPMTAEEMEGKPLDPTGEIVEMVTTAVPPALLAKAQDAAAKGVDAYAKFWSNEGTSKAERQLLQFEHDALKLKAAEVDAERVKEKLVSEEGGQTEDAPTESQTSTGATFGDGPSD